MEAAKAQLGVPFREDGPPLGFEFDEIPLLPGAVLAGVELVVAREASCLELGPCTSTLLLCLRLVLCSLLRMSPLCALYHPCLLHACCMPAAGNPVVMGQSTGSSGGGKKRKAAAAGYADEEEEDPDFVLGGGGGWLCVCVCVCE